MWGSCYENSSGCLVVIVREPVSDSSEDLEEVVNPFEGSVGYPSAAVVGEYFFSPGDDGVHDLLVFGDLAGGVEVSEPSQRPIRPVEVFGFIELVELLERLPRGSQPRMSIEQPIQDAPGGLRSGGRLGVAE